MDPVRRHIVQEIRKHAQHNQQDHDPTKGKSEGESSYQWSKKPVREKIADLRAGNRPKGKKYRVSQRTSGYVGLEFIYGGSTLGFEDKNG